MTEKNKRHGDVGTGRQTERITARDRFERPGPSREENLSRIADLANRIIDDQLEDLKTAAELIRTIQTAISLGSPRVTDLAEMPAYRRLRDALERRRLL